MMEQAPYHQYVKRLRNGFTKARPVCALSQSRVSTPQFWMKVCPWQVNDAPNRERSPSKIWQPSGLLRVASITSLS